MTNARLEARRASNEPKCANCKHWSKRDTESARFGSCQLNGVAVGNNMFSGITTLDLSVCSAWELHEVHTGRILKPDEVIEE